MKRIKAGDTVIVISGDDKGKKGKVLSVAGNRLIVEGINMMKKFVKKNTMGKDQAGTMIDLERPFQISNVQLVDPKTGKGTRISYVITDGKKTRVSKRSGEIIVPVAMEAETAKKEVAEKKAVAKPKAVKEPAKKVVKSKVKKNETA